MDCSLAGSDTSDSAFCSRSGPSKGKGSSMDEATETGADYESVFSPTLPACWDTTLMISRISQPQDLAFWCSPAELDPRGKRISQWGSRECAEMLGFCRTDFACNPPDLPAQRLLQDMVRYPASHLNDFLTANQVLQCHIHCICSFDDFDVPQARSGPDASTRAAPTH